MRLTYRPSRRFKEYVDKILACGHWEDAEQLSHEHGTLRHKGTGELIAYSRHDGGNDHNGPRNFATQAGKICGCQFVGPRGRKSSRKACHPSGFDVGRATGEQLRHAEAVEQLTGQRRELVRQLAELDPCHDYTQCRVLARRIVALDAELEPLTRTTFGQLGEQLGASA